MPEAVLATHAISKKFGALTASDDISIDLRPGEIHAIIGPNGAGKSTLIAQICGTLKPCAGNVELLGRDVTKESARDRARSGLGRTFQISALAMQDTVLQNAVLGALGRIGSPMAVFPARTPGLRTQGRRGECSPQGRPGGSDARENGRTQPWPAPAARGCRSADP